MMEMSRPTPEISTATYSPLTPSGRAGSANFFPRAIFGLKICCTGTCLLINVLTDWVQMWTFAKMGLWVFALLGILVLWVPPFLCYLFRRYMVGYIPAWFGFLFMLQYHIFESMSTCFKTGKFDFSMISATVFEGCFEAYLSAFLGVYAVSIAPHMFLDGEPVPCFFGLFGPLVDPFMVLSSSFIFGIVNMGKVLCYDLDFYGWGRLYLRRNTDVLCYRLLDGGCSAEPEEAHVKDLTEYSVIVKYTKDHFKAEIPLSWLGNVPTQEDGPRYLRPIRFLYRVAEVTHSCLTLVVFASLCRREHLSIHHNGNMWPFFLWGCDYLLMWTLLKQTGESQLKWFFAAFLCICSPPLMLPHFKKIYIRHHLSRIGRALVLFLIVLVKIGWSDIVRRLQLVPWLRRFCWVSTAIWICLIPVQYYLFEREEEESENPEADEGYAQVTTNSRYEDQDIESKFDGEAIHKVDSKLFMQATMSFNKSATSQALTVQGRLDSRSHSIAFPRILCAALSDRNRLLLSILASIMPLDGAMSWALETYDTKSDLLINDLVDLKARIDLGTMEIAVKNEASHKVILLLLKAGAKPSHVAWYGFFQRRPVGDPVEFAELLEVAAFPDDLLDVAVKANAPHEQLVELLRQGATPKTAPIRNAMDQGHSLKLFQELFEVGGELYDRILRDATKSRVSNDVILELLRRGGTPSYLPLEAALERSAPLSDVKQLLQARANIYDGILKTALNAKSCQHDVLLELLQLGGTPADAPLRRGLELKWSTDSLSTLLKAKAEIYDGILQTACDFSAPVSTLELLLRAGGTPRSVVLPAALRQRCSIESFKSLLDAKAELFDGLLQIAYDSGYNLDSDKGAWKELVSLPIDSAYKPEEIVEHQDMDRPFSEYWISSSHNTYLERDQFYGESTAEQYVKVLKTGCRCVEIDIWNGPTDPVVTHGHAFCSTVSLIDVTNACNEHAFEKTDLPLILSVEMRCASSKQWGRCIEIFRNSFGDRLLLHPDEHEAAKTPHQLRGRVLVKSKLFNSEGAADAKGDDVDADDFLASEEETQVMEETLKELEESLEADVQSELNENRSPRRTTLTRGSDEAKVSAVKHIPSKVSNEEKILPMVAAISNAQKRTASNVTLLDEEDPVDDKSTSYGCLGRKKKKADWKTATLLTAYDNYVFFPGMKFKASHLDEPEARSLYNISSFQSQVFEKWTVKHVGRFREYHARALSRTYPPNINVKSDNYNPLLPWYHGVQMVALNYQKFDRHLLLNEGFFRHQNGGVGYVLKPPLALGQKVEAEKLTMQLRILSIYEVSMHEKPRRLSGTAAGSQPINANARPRCCIKVKLYDAIEELVEHCTKISYAKDTSGTDFTWNEVFEFEVRHVEVAILTVEVLVNNEPRYHSAHPVKILREGIRLLPLWGYEKEFAGCHYEQVGSKLLTKIDFKSHR